MSQVTLKETVAAHQPKAKLNSLKTFTSLSKAACENLTITFTVKVSIKTKIQNFFKLTKHFPLISEVVYKIRLLIRQKTTIVHDYSRKRNNRQAK